MNCLRHAVLIGVLVLCIWGTACGEDVVYEPLDPDTMAFYYYSESMIIESAMKDFYKGHHGRDGIAIFGDGRFIRVDESGLTARGYRVFREGMVPADMLDEMVDRAHGLERGDMGYFYPCEDAVEDEVLGINIPELDFWARAYPTFGYQGACQVDSNRIPPDDMVELVELIKEVPSLESTEIVTDRIKLAGVNVYSEGSDGACGSYVAWPFDEFEWPDAPAEWSVVVEAPLAGEIRDFLRENMTLRGSGYGVVCVSRNFEDYQMWYDDVPDEDELMKL